MKRHWWTVVFGVQAALVVALAAVLWGTPSLPLGVRGEWEWPRIHVALDWSGIAIALSGLALYAAFVGAGFRSLTALPSRRAQLLWLAGLVPAAVLLQVVLLAGAPGGYGLTKWVTLGMPGASGYFSTARREVRDANAFWACYPKWIVHQDSLHIGTHPPGLLLASHALIEAMERHPAWSEAVDSALPGTVRTGFRQILGPVPRPDRAAMCLAGLLTLILEAATVLPLYLLAREIPKSVRASGVPPCEEGIEGGGSGAVGRETEPPPTPPSQGGEQKSGISPSPSRRSADAWATAALWPLVPALILFHPTADGAYPFLSTLVMLLAVRGRWIGGLVAGALLAVGAQFTLAYGPVGLIAVTVIMLASGTSWRDRFLRMVAMGLGFLGFTVILWAASGANPFVIWHWNARNHARFYVEYPRSYGPWILANIVELAVGLGLPIVVWGVIGARRWPAITWATCAMLVLLTITGRNLGEVGRLWQLYLPFLVIGTGTGFARARGGPVAIVLTIVLLGVQVLLLQATIQVVYPV